MALLRQGKKDHSRVAREDENDTGSSEVQIALLTENIMQLQEIIQLHKKITIKNWIDKDSKLKKALAYLEK